MKLLNDQNSKVSVSAASTFSGLIETLRAGIEANLTIVCTTTFILIGSSNASIKNLGEGLLNQLIDKLEFQLLVP